MEKNQGNKQNQYYNLEKEEVIDILNTNLDGLSSLEVDERMKNFGKNKLNEGKHKTIFSMYLSQFKDVMIIVLFVAAIISALMHEITDAIIILVVIILNAIMGVIQENKAEKALEALKKMSAPYVKVKRDNTVTTVKSENIVVGDIVLLEAGDFVPADIRLFESASLSIDESLLTGESVPVEKNKNVIQDVDVVLGDRKNMAYSSSIVTYGRGTGVVTATGMNTEVGDIASNIINTKTELTPLQKKLAEMSKLLTIVILIVAVIIFIAGAVQGRDYFDMLLISISLSVAAIPEGLPAVVTIILAMGVLKMSKRNAIIRKLSSVETLGCTEIICSDKTGTLTQNKMTVKELYIGDSLHRSDNIDPHNTNLNVFMEAMVLCNDSKLQRDGNEFTIMGDPTETALIYYAEKLLFKKDDLEIALPRVGEIPFDSDRKLMTTIHKLNDNYRVMTKGAPDILQSKCSHILIDGNVILLTDSHVENILSANKEMAQKALRILAVAYKDIDTNPNNPTPGDTENGLIFAGLVGMIDPPRQEAEAAITICNDAGIRVVMITGDHRDTACAIAKDLGIINDETEVLTGIQLDKMSDKDLENNVSNYSVYARVSPEHKVRIVKAWKKQGKVVAMTGDGVNDAPALKAADIGVGMGITGTDVSKSVSDIILTDDNFATIVAAVEEGRKIYSNIKKAIQFLLSSNIGEIVTLFIATMLNWSVLMPIHILWVNLVTDALPALALGMEKAEDDIMNQPPRSSKKSFFADGMGIGILYQGVSTGLITLGAYYIGLVMYGPAVATTIAFATLSLIQLAHSLNMRSQTKSLFKIGFLSNKYLNAAIITATLLQVVVIIVPYLNPIFKVTFLTLEQWLIVIIASTLIIPIVEVVKFINFRKKK
ncbi:MAG TPA: calcium-translocating P-type ATPase, SERCA-type [Clostridia bacterium]|nr:calcium-translocating P-type ATPase, SERCA-type [Clostridia bacterium]